MDFRQMPLFLSSKGPLNGGDLQEALVSLGVREGDDLCVHSAVSAFGFPAVKAKELSGVSFLGVFTEALQTTIGDTGTLLMPTFSYSFCKGQPFDVEKTPSDVGSLTEYFRKAPGVKRTAEPIFSFAVRGAGELDYLNAHHDECFGPRSAFGTLYRRQAKILALGCPLHNALTFIHFVEKSVSVPYRYDKVFKGTIIQEGTERPAEVRYFVRALDRKSTFSEAIIRSFLKRNDNLKSCAFGEGTLLLIDVRRLYDELVKALNEDPLMLLE